MNTILGAVIAMLIAFSTGFLALMQQPDVFGVGDVSEKAWVVLAVGCMVTFLKDYQAIATRSVINKVTGTGDGGGHGPLPKRGETPQE